MTLDTTQIYIAHQYKTVDFTTQNDTAQHNTAPHTPCSTTESVPITTINLTPCIMTCYSLLFTQHRPLPVQHPTQYNTTHHTVYFTGSTVRKIVPPAFTVTPSEISLRPRTATAFTFRGNHPTPSLLREIFVLESKIGDCDYLNLILRYLISTETE